MSPTRLLDSVTVLDLSSVGPASRASRILADYGADVIKVGPTARKGSVQIKPPFHTYGAGRGMRRVQIDLKQEKGVDVFLRMASRADVVIESFRPGVVKRLGIGYDDVRRVNGRIVYCSTSGYGQSGPYSQWAGHDLNYLALSGYLACSGPRADGGPPIPGATVADSAGGGMHAVIAILAALVRRASSGVGEYLDVAASEGVLSLMSLTIDQYLATGEATGPGDTLLTGRYACYDIYRARDGKWLAVGAIEPQFFAQLCRLLGVESYADRQMDDAAQDEIRAAFREKFAERDRDEWVAALAPNNTCVAPVNTIAELVQDPHFKERGVFMNAEHSGHGAFTQVGPVLAGGVRDQPTHRVPDPDTTNTAEILAELELEKSEIDELLVAGVVE
jgi:alpha-methylacyl-CoA racemase